MNLKIDAPVSMLGPRSPQGPLSAELQRRTRVGRAYSTEEQISAYPNSPVDDDTAATAAAVAHDQNAVVQPQEPVVQDGDEMDTESVLPAPFAPDPDEVAVVQQMVAVDAAAGRMDVEQGDEKGPETEVDDQTDADADATDGAGGGSVIVDGGAPNYLAPQVIIVHFLLTSSLITYPLHTLTRSYAYIIPSD